MKGWFPYDREPIDSRPCFRQTDKMKRSFFQAAVVSILLYECTTWTLTKRLEKKLDGNYTRMLRAILNKSWRQHPTRHQLYGHLPCITKTIQVRGTRHAGHCWRSKGELISDVLLWTPTYGQAKAGRPARTYIQQLCEDTGCNPENLPGSKLRERVRDIRAGGMTWWWWWRAAEKVQSQISWELSNFIHFIFLWNYVISIFSSKLFLSGTTILAGYIQPKNTRTHMHITLPIKYSNENWIIYTQLSCFK